MVRGGLGNSTNIVEKPISIGTVVGWQSGASSSIDGCSASGVVVTSGDGQAVGGIVGNIGGGTITNCMSTVSIKASGLAYVGGIAGYTKSYEKATVEMSSCVYAGSELSAEGSYGKYESKAGAIVGHQYKGKVTFSNLYYDNDMFESGVGTTTTGGSTTGSVTGVTDVNSVNVVCQLNGGTIVDGECDKDYPWSEGENTVSLYGSDGFTVTFNAKSGEFPDGAKKKKIIFKDKVITSDEISTPIHADSAFAGWSLNPEATEPDADLGLLSGVTTVYAVWYPIYTITFSAAPGTYVGGEIVEKTVKVAKGDIISVTGIEVPATYVKNGSTLYFTGWSNVQKEFDADDDITASDTLHLDDIVATGNMTFYAAWTKAQTFTVTYNANGHGKTKVDFVNVEKNQTLTEPPAPTPDNGYEYSGWCLNVTECDKDHHFDFETKIDKNYTLYADWNAVEYKIIYNLNGGTNNAGNPPTYTIEDASIVFQDPVREGYNFKGWFYDKNFSDGAKQITAGSTGDKTIHAKWEEKIYEIAYMAGSGAVGSISPTLKKHGLPITLAEGGRYTREGYTQDGWATEDGGTVEYALGGTYTANAAITLYPHWTEKVYPFLEHDFGAIKVYENSDGTLTAEIDGNSSETVNIPSAVTVNHVVFIRTFTVGKNSTIMLPFTIDTTKIAGGSFKDFSYVDESERKAYFYKDVYQGVIKANTPYIFVPDAEALEFNLGEGETVILNSTSEIVVPTSKLDYDGGKWEFRGTYSHVDWPSGDKHVWGFVANTESDPEKVGKFKRAGTGTYIEPLRGYLYNTQLEEPQNQGASYAPRPMMARPDYASTETASIDNEPASGSMEVEFITRESEETTFVGRLNSRNGEVRVINSWHDMKGRELNSKPTTKGIYYFNGKRVMVR